MRDRTLVMLALVFLTLTIGFGVNRSLASLNMMMGTQVAPGAEEVYRQNAETVLNRVGELRSKALFMSEHMEPLKERFLSRLTTAAGTYREKVLDLLQMAKEWATAKKQAIIT